MMKNNEVEPNTINEFIKNTLAFIYTPPLEAKPKKKEDQNYFSADDSKKLKNMTKVFTEMRNIFEK